MTNPAEVQSVCKRDGERFIVRADEKLTAFLESRLKRSRNLNC
jgi:hypothetical protein